MEYELDEKLKEIAQKVIEDKELLHIKIEDVVFSKTDANIKKGKQVVIGQCFALSKITQFLTEKTYMIMTTPIFYTLNDTDKYIIMYHELLHIPEDVKNLRFHDFEEFDEIISEYRENMLDINKIVHKKIEDLEKLEKLKKQKEKLEKKEKGDRNEWWIWRRWNRFFTER